MMQYWDKHDKVLHECENLKPVLKTITCLRSTLETASWYNRQYTTTQKYDMKICDLCDNFTSH